MDDTDNLSFPKFSFIELRVNDLDQAVLWYQRVFGLLPIFEDKKTRFVLLNRGSFSLALKEKESRLPSVTPEDSIQKKWLLAFEVEDLTSEQTRLQSLGLELKTEYHQSSEGYHQIRISDLDGNLITIYSWKKS